jgi:hypothetical protein
MTKRRTSPEDVAEILGYAMQHQPCDDCGAGPGEPCTRPGPGRTVHKARYIGAAIAVRQEARATRRTPEQTAELEAVLAGLPRVPRAEIEACRTPAGGYSFTRERLAGWGVPWPPPSGWLAVLLRGEDDSDTSTERATSS